MAYERILVEADWSLNPVYYPSVPEEFTFVRGARLPPGMVSLMSRRLLVISGTARRGIINKWG